MFDETRLVSKTNIISLLLKNDNNVKQVKMEIIIMKNFAN